jgi:hypothetical protein
MKSLSCGKWIKACALLGVALSLSASTAFAQTAEEVIEKSLKAQGGKAALMGLKAIERKGDVAVDGAFGQMEGSVEEIVIPGKKALRALDLAVFVQKDCWTGEAAWRDGMNGIQDIEGDEAIQIKQAAMVSPLLMIGQDESTAKKLDDEKVEDVDYYVLEVSAKDRPAVKMYIDKADDLLKRVTLTQNNPQFGEVEIVTGMTDYADYGPVKLANKQTIAIGEVLSIETTYTETKVDGEVDEKVFEKPEEPAPAPAADAPAEEKKDDAKDGK